RNHSLNIKTEDLGILPGDNNKDLLVSLRALPGISTVTGRAGELRVRGGTPDQTLVLFDNIPIYHKGYYYGTISPFSTDIVDEVKVYRSGFNPRLGGRVGGAIEINSTKKVPEKVTAGLGTSSVFGNGYLKLPIVEDKLGLTVSARTSYDLGFQVPIEKEFEEMVVVGSVFDFQSRNDGVTLDPLDFTFRDVNGNLIYQLNEKHRFNFNFLSIDNENAIDLTDENRRFTEDIRSILDNRGVNFSWNGSFGNWANEFFITRAAYQYAIEDDKTRLDDRPMQNQTWDNRLNTTKLGNILKYRKPDNGGEYSFGYELTQLRARFDRTNTVFRRMGPTTTREGSNQKGTIHSVFGNYYLPEWNNFMFDIGLRANLYNRSDFANLEPRLFVNYSVNDRWTLKSSAGYYSQYLTRNIFFELGDLPIEKLVWELVVSREGVITSEQYLTGATYQAKDWVFDIDIYYKHVAGVTTNSGFEASPDSGARKLVGDLFSKGVDFLIRRKLGAFNLWANYTLAKVDLRFPRLKTENFPANYDQRHNINLTTTYQKGPWRASLGWIFASGIPDYRGDDFFPTTIGADDQPGPPTTVGDLPRFDPVHQLDGSVAYVYQPDSKKLKFTLGLSILNLYDRENVLETLISTGAGPGQGANNVNRSTIGFAPDIMLKIEW
ncbi:MAG: TonB-dependent receptor plug domain-containing protein, partial [Bacteroidota bacterium]